MSVFIPTQPPTSVPTAADLATPSARTGDGFVVSTTGQETPGDNGAAAYIYHMTGRSGQVMDSGAYRAGPGVDDWWEVTKKDVLNLSIYPIDNTGIVDDGYLPLTNDVPGETLLVNEGAYLIASNYTLNRRVQFEYGARFKIANGFNLHLAAGYVAEPTQWVFDISDGGTVTVDNMPGVSVAHWGAVPDYVASPAAGTNSSPMIQAAFDASEGIAANKSWTEPKRPEVFVPPGSYRLDTGVILRNKSNLYAVGAKFVYWGSMASNGAILTIGEFAGVGNEIEAGTFFLPSTQGLPANMATIPVANEEFVGTRIDACGSSVFNCDVTNYVPIGLQLKPYSKTFVAHNHFLNHKAWAVKVAIDFVWQWDQDEDLNIGWSNENVFTNCNFTTDSASIYFGSTIGCRMRCINTRPGFPTWDFGGSNNNRFFGQCYQPGGTNASVKLDIGDVVVQNRRYVNYTTRQEYICDVAGTVATVPTNTDYAQSPADANGVRFTHRGPYYRSGVLLDKNGGFNLWHGTRWEGGDGPFCYIANSGQNPPVANISRGNEMVLYDYCRVNEVAEFGKVLIDDYTLARRNEYAGFRNTARLYGEDHQSNSVTISDIHKRFVASASGQFVRGMVWFDYARNEIQEYSDYGLGNWRLLKDAVYELSSKLLGVIVDLKETKRLGGFKLSWAPEPLTTAAIAGDGTAPGTIHAVPLDSNNQMVIVPDATTTSCVSNGLYGSNRWTIGGEPIYFGVGTDTDITRVFIGTGGGNGSLSTHLELHTVPGGWVNHSVLSVLTPDAGRFSIGTPTGGFFLELNEFIRHHTSDVFESSGWRVRVPGILTQPWVTATAVTATELRMTGGNVYASLAGGTTGATEITGGTPVVFTADAGTNEIISNAHGLTNGTKVKFSGPYLPTGLTKSTLFYIVGATANRFQVSLTLGGSAVDLASSGSGTMLYNAIVNDGTIDWEWISVEAELEEIFEGAALPVSQPPVTGNLTLYTDQSSSSWWRENTYVSQKVLSGDFDITFLAPTQNQTTEFGVTELTDATEFNNYQNFSFGIYRQLPTEVTIYWLAVTKTYTIAGWGNRLVRLVRTGTTLDMYINDVLIALETATFTADAGTDVITSAAHGLVDGRPVRFEGVDLPTGIVQGTVYYVRDSATNTFKIAASIGGSAVNITDAGSGTMTFFANAITSNDVRVMYSAYNDADTAVTIYNDDYKPTVQGKAIVASLESVQDKDEFEEITSSATPTFRWTIFPGRTKMMELTANVSSMTFLVNEAGQYRIILTQDATGGRTVVFPAGIKGTQPTLNLLGGESTIFDLIYTRTEWYWGNVVTTERVNVTLDGTAAGVAWDITNTYISNDTLTGDFDITFDFIDRTQNYIVGVTTNTLPTALNNYTVPDFGTYHFTDGFVQVYKRGATTNYAIPTFGNGLVRLVRTGANLDLYVNNALVAAANDPAFTTDPVRRIYTADVSTSAECVLFGDLSVPIAIGANLTQVNDAIPDENGTETVSFSATAVFNFTVDPRKNKTMTLTANATGLVVIAPTPGVYYLTLTQDGTGNWTVAFATTINGTAPTMSAGAGTSTLFPFYSNGSQLFWM